LATATKKASVFFLLISELEETMSDQLSMAVAASTAAKPPGAWRRRYALASKRQTSSLASTVNNNSTETLPTLEKARSQLKTVVNDKENSCKYLRKRFYNVFPSLCNVRLVKFYVT
jgi:hypothetical protein